MTAPSIADQPRHVRITADGVTGSIAIDGTDISKSVQGYNLEHRVGAAPLLVLYTAPHRGLDFEGLSHVAVGDQADPGEVVAAFLVNIDAADLERAALNRDDLDGTSTELTRAMLRQLADWAQGRVGS